MPLLSLSEKEWEKLNYYIENVKDNDLQNILQKLQINQSRLEIINNYNEYYLDKLSEPVSECSLQLLIS
jgi:hypothetical protein